MRQVALVVSVLMMVGCASERIVLLPSADGQPSAIVVRNLQGERQAEQWIDQPYTASVRRSGYNSLKAANVVQVEPRFVAAISALPARARSFTLYFEFGSDELTSASLAEFEQAKVEFQTRAAAEVTVIGHTDRVGSDQDNDILAQNRADAVRLLLIEAGIADSAIETTSRGEREPLLATQDGVEEPLNRRVEISLR